MTEILFIKVLKTEPNNKIIRSFYEFLQVAGKDCIYYLKNLF